jgi:uncharacterized protein YggE
MRRTLVAAVLLSVLFAAPALAQQGAGMPGAPSISTEGRASIKVTPDVAWVTVTAESRALKTADAQKQNAIAMDSVRAALKQAGVPEDAAKTRSYSVEPEMQYTNGKAKVVGYIARQSLEVRIDDLARLGTVIDAAGGSGATSISGIRYDVKDRSAIERKLLGDAVKDGMQRVTALAVGAGAELLRIWRIDEQRLSDNNPQPMYRMAAQAAPAPPTLISPEEIEIRAQVSLTVLLK